jgi:hypothetical protein
MSTEMLISVGAAVLAGYIVYKALNYVNPVEAMEPPTMSTTFYGDDKMTRIQGLHNENRIAPVLSKPVDSRLHDMQVLGAMIQMDPQFVDHPPNESIKVVPTISSS